MKCVSALSTLSGTEAAFEDVLGRLAAGLSGTCADLAVAFVSADHAEDLAGLGRAILSRKIARHVLACTAESIIGDGREIEESSAVSLWAVEMPGVQIKPLRLDLEDDRFPDDIAGESAGTLLMLGDPFTFPAEEWLNRLPAGIRAIGGMASAAKAPGGNRLVLDDGEYDDGAIGVLLDSSAKVRAVVSQGCRPIGRSLIVTKVERNVIRELGRRPAMEALQELFESLEPAEQELVRGGLHLGRVINEYQETFERGDFLVRNVLGTDGEGGIGVTDMIRVGQTVRFHVRDAETADEELRELLAIPAKNAGSRAIGALVFSCNGRGTRLFAEADHDATVVRETLGPIPAAGFFAMGELGPVGDRNFVHGFTASIAVFEE